MRTVLKACSNGFHTTFYKQFLSDRLSNHNPKLMPPFKMELSHNAIPVKYEINSSPASWQFTILNPIILVFSEQFNFQILEATGSSNIRVSPSQYHPATPTSGQSILSKTLQAMRAGEQLCSLQVA